MDRPTYALVKRQKRFIIERDGEPVYSPADFLRPKFGARCVECDDQIEPRRVRINPQAKLCRDCQTEDEMHRQRVLQGARDNDIVIIRSR